MGTWISVKDALPPQASDSGPVWPRSEFVLCWCPGWSPSIFVLQAAFVSGTFAGWVGPQSESVTHWQPMPPAPEGSA